MDIMKFMEDKLEDSDVISKLSNSENVDSLKIRKASKLCIPTMLKALQRNASSSEGAKSLEMALNQHKDDNVEDVSRYLQNLNHDEGEKVLTHIFGSNKDRIQANIAKETELEDSQISHIMKQLAPLLLGMLGQKKKKQDIGSSGITDFLGDIMNISNGGIMDKVTRILDRDGDGSIMDEVTDVIGGLFDK